MEKVERRSFVRVPYKSEVILKSQASRIDATIKNLCLAGGFINTKEEIEQDTEVEIEILFDDPLPADSNILNAKVVRIESEGIAVQFKGMSLNVYERLRDIIGDRYGDKEKVVSEFLKFMAQRKEDHANSCCCLPEYFIEL